MSTITIPTELLATLAAGTVERDELRERAEDTARTFAEQHRQIHDLSQERLRESERATEATQAMADLHAECRGLRANLDERTEQHAAARREIDQLTQALLNAEDARQQAVLDLEAMREARDTLRDEQQPAVVAERPLEAGDRVVTQVAGRLRGTVQGDPYSVIEQGDDGADRVDVLLDGETEPSVIRVRNLRRVS